MNANDPIDRRRAEDARVAIADDGFSRRVLGALPAPAPRASRWRPALILGSTALGALLATALGATGPALVEGFADLAIGRALTAQATAALALALTLAISAAVLVADSD